MCSTATEVSSLVKSFRFGLPNRRVKINYSYRIPKISSTLFTTVSTFKSSNIYVAQLSNTQSFKLLSIEFPNIRFDYRVSVSDRRASTSSQVRGMASRHSNDGPFGVGHERIITMNGIN